MNEYEKLISTIITNHCNNDKKEIMLFFVRYLDIVNDNKNIHFQASTISIKQMRDAIEKIHPEYLNLFDNIILLK